MSTFLSLWLSSRQSQILHQSQNSQISSFYLWGWKVSWVCTVMHIPVRYTLVLTVATALKCLRRTLGNDANQWDWRQAPLSQEAWAYSLHGAGGTWALLTVLSLLEFFRNTDASQAKRKSLVPELDFSKSQVIVVVSSGCYYKILQTEWLKQRTFISYSSGSWKWDHGACIVDWVLARASLPGYWQLPSCFIFTNQEGKRGEMGSGVWLEKALGCPLLQRQ